MSHMLLSKNYLSMVAKKIHLQKVDIRNKLVYPINHQSDVKQSFTYDSTDIYWLVRKSGSIVVIFHVGVTPAKLQTIFYILWTILILTGNMYYTDIIILKKVQISKRNDFRLINLEKLISASVLLIAQAYDTNLILIFLTWPFFLNVNEIF